MSWIYTTIYIVVCIAVKYHLWPIDIIDREICLATGD